MTVDHPHANTGYLLLYGLLDEQLLSAARERVWATAPPGLDRADRTTWAGPFTEAQTAGSRKGFHGLYENCRSGFIWKDRVAGATEDLLELVPRALFPIAEQVAPPPRLCPRRRDGLFEHC